MLAVVQYQQQPARGAVLHDPPHRVVLPDRVGHAAGVQHRLAQPERGEQRVGHRARVVQRGQFGDPDAVRPAPGRLGGPVGLGELFDPPGLDGQPGLPGTARSGQGGQPARPQGGPERAEIGVPTDEAGQPRAQVADRARAAGRRGAAGRSLQQFLVDGPQLRPRVGAQLLRQRPPGGLELPQRVGHPSAVAQRADQQHLRLLVQRSQFAQLGQLGGQFGGPAERQLGPDPVPPDVLALRLQPGGGPGPVRQVGEGGAAPERERRAQLLGGTGVFGGVQRLPPLGGQPLELPEVAARPGQPVARRARADLVPADGPAQPADQRLQCGRGVLRRVRAPHLVGQQLRRHRPPLPQDQRGQQRAQPRTAQRYGGAVVLPGRGGAEDAVVHRPIVIDTSTGTAVRWAIGERQTGAARAATGLVRTRPAGHDRTLPSSHPPRPLGAPPP